ncbi:multiheme c-type cytochrome [Pseudocnuella soli]|uniref:multiheme c-type cytochrome n=1 Tax=Pseudocnuella soli TaxID=2502779 RepID=UPI001042C8B7|nr:multiheme c-type cytochrome [Pseudocnuella soli]
MKNRALRSNRGVWMVTAIAALVTVFVQCMQQPAAAGTDLRGAGYAGAEACRSCHANIYDSYLHTAHNRSTAPANEGTIKGSFEKDSNEYYYQPHVKVAMERRDSGLYQVAYLNNQEQQAFRFDLVVGSGRKAQTFLYYQDDKVFQLPVSYFVPMQRWANSPNYPAKQVRFDRNIPIGCFECHSSYIRRTNVSAQDGFRVDHFDQGKIIYGIDCERCHGPAAQHVQFHQANPTEKTAQHIPVQASLTRQQKMDVCATCHSGLRESIKPTFRFTPGAQLSEFLPPDTTKPDPNAIDVHGNQVQLLQASACFENSITMDCSSCHNPHTTERTNMAVFSQRCMSCHQPTGTNFCPKEKELGTGIRANCIDCHMPAKESHVISLQSQGSMQPTPNLVRTHLIGIYPGEGNRFKKL